MPTSLLRSAGLLLLLAVAAVSAQTPIFTPVPPRGEGAPPGEEAAAGAPADAEVAKAREAEGIDLLFERLRRWPTRPARDASLSLAGLGSKVRDRLLAGLADPDWRVQSGAASALAEMGAKEAIPVLRQALGDPSNRAAFPYLLPALVALDPVEGPATVFPFLSHSSGKVRVAARRAMPAVVDPRYLPEVIEQLRSRSGAHREAGLELLARIPGAEEHDEFFHALADPAARVASAAAEHLGSRGTQRVRERLLELARTAPLRRATHAMLALVLAEDRSGERLIPEQGAIYKRALAAIASKDPFYRGAAAILLSNLSYRSDDPELRQMADRFLVPILLNTVAGGVFYSDYTSLEALCWQKLEMLTGQAFGPDAPRWWAWWEQAKDAFLAQRELRSIDVDQLAASDLLVVRELPDASLIQIRLTGREAVLGDPDPKAPLVLSERQRGTLAELIRTSGFFDSRGEVREPGRPEGFTEFLLSCGNTRYRRFHHGALPEDLQPLFAFVERVRRELAWQRFAPGDADAGSRRAFLAEQQAFFQAQEDPARRRERIQDLAVRAYPGLPRVTRALASAVLSEASGDWVARHRPELLACLEAEERLTDEAAALTRLLAREATAEVREAVVQVISRGSTPRGDLLLREFLAAQPMQGVLPLMTDARARVRALAAESLSRFRNEPAVADVLIAGLKDYEPRVRDACIKSLAALGDERALGLLENILAGDDATLRPRVIVAMGAVGGEAIVPRLMEIYRAGEDGDRWAVIAALKEARGRRAVVQLAGLVRDDGPLELRKEALDALIDLGGTDVSERLVEILKGTREGEIRVLVIGGLARILGDRAVPLVREQVDSELPDVRRMALITLARLGDATALAPLLPYLEAIEGDLAAERALQRLTFFEAKRPAPSMRVEEWKSWAKSYGALTRDEWFHLAAKRAQVALDPAVNWLEATELTWPQRLLLLRVVEGGTPGARFAAEQTLLRIAATDAAPLSLAASPEEIRERVIELRQWLAQRR